MSSFSFRESIESLKNNRVKMLSSLKDGKGRRKHKMFYVEGAREIARAISGGMKAKELYVCPSLLTEKTYLELKGVEAAWRSLPLIEVTKDIFSKVAMRGDQDGLIALFPIVEEPHELSSNAKFVLVAENVEKPGNLGALLRTADGAGVDVIVLVDSPIDIYSPHTIRASLGAVFHIPVIKLENKDALVDLQSKGFTIVAASPEADCCYYDFNFKEEKLAVVLGSEATGLSATWRDQAKTVSIPMKGICDSLNVSVSGAIMLYEAQRQRSY